MKISRKSFASYTDLEFNKFLVDKGKHFAEKFNDKRVIDSNSLKVVTAIGLLDKNVKILDVGGSVGTHHFLAKFLYFYQQCTCNILLVYGLITRVSNSDARSL